jgi:Arc/MetJ-type ribon-helix-helix transcriptional regulator
MAQNMFSLDETHLQFLERFNQYGFKDKSELVRTALNRLRSELELQQLQESAQLYSKVYEDDLQTQGLTEWALLGWPE